MYGVNIAHQQILNVRLETNGGPLGITLAGSEDMQKPIVISGLVEGGLAHSTGHLRVGDCLLAINTENVQGTPLSNATKLLQRLDKIVELKIARNLNGNLNINKSINKTIISTFTNYYSIATNF